MNHPLAMFERFLRTVRREVSARSSLSGPPSAKGCWRVRRSARFCASPSATAVVLSVRFHAWVLSVHLFDLRRRPRAVENGLLCPIAAEIERERFGGRGHPVGFLVLAWGIG